MIAYSLKYSSIENIFKTITNITEIDFFKDSNELGEIIIEHFDLDIKGKLDIDKNRIFKNLKEVYEIRNVICHDILSTKFKLDMNNEKFKEYLFDSFLFQCVIDQKLSEVWSSKESDSLESQIEKKNEELNLLYDRLKNEFKFEEQIINLEKSKLSFQKFIKEDSENMGNNFVSYNRKDILFPELIQQYKLRLINQKIENIKSDIEMSS